MKQFIFFAGVLILTSCSTNRYLSSPATPPTDIVSMDYLPPVSFIQYIEKGNRAKPSDSLSAITSGILHSTLENNRQLLRLGREIVLADSAEKAKVEEELAYLIRRFSNQGTLVGVEIPPAIDRILMSNIQRFTVATVATGFGRRKGNYGGQIAKGVGIGILTLGMVVPTPLKANLSLYTLIFDSARNEITYFSQSLPTESEPTNPRVLENQLLNLFNGYFYNKKR